MRCKSQCLVLLTLVGFLLIAADTAVACICGPKPTVPDAFIGSDLVVIAKTLSVKKKESNDTGSVIIQVEHVYKGRVKPGDRLTLALEPPAPCTFDLKEVGIGESLLLYQSRLYKHAGKFIVDLCGRTTLFKYANEDLLYLNDRTKHQDKTRISGILFFATSPHEAFQRAAGVKIQITGEHGSFTVTTDSNGVYELYGAPAGNYQVRPQVPSNWKLESWSSDRFVIKRDVDGEVVLREKKHAYLNITYLLQSNP